MSRRLRDSTSGLGFFCLSLQWQPLFPHHSSGWTAQGNQVPPTLLKGQVHDHLRNLIINESLGYNELHSRLLRGTGGFSCQATFHIQMSQQSGKVPADWKGGKKEDSDLSASSLCLGSSRDTSSRKLYYDTCRTDT